MRGVARRDVTAEEEAATRVREGGRNGRSKVMARWIYQRQHLPISAEASLGGRGLHYKEGNKETGRRSEVTCQVLRY